MSYSVYIYSMTSDDDEFQPTENTEDNNDEKYLNKKTGIYISNSFIKTIILVITVIAFIIGYTIGSGVIAGTLCFTDQISTFTGSPDSLASSGSGGEDITESLQSQFVNCTKTSLFTTGPIIAGIVSGLMGAYPGYRIGKALSSGKHLRSMI